MCTKIKLKLINNLIIQCDLYGYIPHYNDNAGNVNLLVIGQTFKVKIEVTRKSNPSYPISNNLNIIRIYITHQML